MNQRDGGQFMLRVMANDGRTNIVTNIDQQFRLIFPQVQGNYEFDMFTGDRSETGLWFIECKSTDELPAEMGQLTAYFSAIQNISNLEYIFNTKKIGTETQAKEAIQAQLISGGTFTAKGNTLFEAIWANTVLRGNLFPDDQEEDDYDSAKAKFATDISLTSNLFYNFIKIK